MRYINARNTAYGEDRRTYKESDSGVSSTQRVFNVSYDNGRVEAYLNGVRLFPGDDYTKTSSGIGTSITLASDLGSNNVLEIVGYQGINSGNALVEDNFVVGTSSTGSGGSYTNSTTEFPVASSAGDTVSVWRNGIKLVPTTDYTVQVSANTVTLLSAASSDDEITVQVVGGVIHNNGLTVNSGSNSFFLPTTRGTDAYVLTRDDSAGTGGTAWKLTVQGPTITGIKYSNQTSGTFAENSGQTATDPAGGDLVQLTGTNFDSTAGGAPSNIGIIIDGTAPSSITVNSAGTEATFTAPAKSAGSYTLTATNGSGLNATTTIVYDSVPSWTATGALGNFVIGDSFTNSSSPNIRIQASESSDTISYKQVTSNTDTTVITSGVAGLTLGTSGADAGYLTGTLGGIDGATNNFYAVATDAENQDSAPTLFNFITRTYPAGGGTLETGQSGYAVHVFGDTGNEPGLNATAVVTFTVYRTITGADILIVGGGGGGAAGGTGANVGAGGGGAGGMRVLTNETLNAGTYTVTVGGGGSGGDYSSSTHTFNVSGARSGRKGVSSSIIQQTGTGSYSYTAEGGGHGDYQMSGHLYTTVQASQSGGSGGGASNINANHGTGVGSGSNGDTEGYYGSDGGESNGNEGGGGGGANAIGGTGPGNGGDGLSNSFRTGSGVTYAGGGGGAKYSGYGNNGTGGSGGGGDAVGSGTPGHGEDGKGGGGGGTVNTSSVDGGNGGSGIIVIRYAI